MNEYLEETKLLDYRSGIIDDLVKERFSTIQNMKEKAEAIYYFVRDNIVFGYNASDDIPATEVLRDGYGQCNTKTILFMALARACGIPCRVHFFKIHKRVQEGIFAKWIYKRFPDELIHSWPEVQLEGNWIALEGIILDDSYLQQIKNKFATYNEFEGYAVSVEDLLGTTTNWTGVDTSIQKGSITVDDGVYASPDEYYHIHGTNAHGVKSFLFKHYIRKRGNRRIKSIRSGKLQKHWYKYSK